MAIKIDLLPGYVGLRRWFKRVLVICVALIAVVASVLALFYYRDKQRLDKLKADLANIETFAAQTEATRQQAEAAVNETAPVRTAVNFMADASKTGAERAALIDLIRRYVYAGAVVSTLDLSDGATAKFTATVRTPDEYARFLLSLRRGSDQAQAAGPLFTGLPQGSGIPGYPDNRPIPGPETVSYTPEPITFPLRIDASGQLKNPMAVPVEPGGAAPAAGGAPGMPPGGSPPGATPSATSGP
jgi:hypothetical protein